MKVILASVLVETSPQAIPLGAADIASFVMIKAQAEAVTDITVDLVTISCEEFPDSASSILAEKICAYIRDDEKIYVGFSVYVWNRAIIEIAASIVRKKNTSVILCAGGPEITAVISIGQYTDKENVFDFLIAGEGESAVWTIVRNIYFENMAHNENKKTKIIFGTAENCNELPSPWLNGVIDPAQYDGGVLWELSRGCPFSCSYCYESKGEKKVRYFSAERIEEELHFFSEKNVTQVFVLDPTFNANRERALHILALIEKYTADIFFHFEIRAEFIDVQLVKAFSKIPCSLQIGLQSANPSVIEKIGRTFNPKEFKHKIALLNEYNITFGLDVIYGLPTDTIVSFFETLQYALALYPNHLEVFKLSVLPATRLYESAKEFSLSFLPQPPYHIQCTPQFSAKDLQRAGNVALALTFFYSQGRAVPWFLSVLKPLKINAVQFFSDFYEWNTEYQKANLECSEHAEIEKIQLLFLKHMYAQKKLLHVFDAVFDIVRLHGACSRAVGEGLETILELQYHPDDIFGYSSFDIMRFSEETCMERCRIRVFENLNDIDVEFIY